MIEADLPPPHDPVTAAACELKVRHHVSRRPPQHLDVLARLTALPAWTEQARVASSNAEPEATKAAEWILDNHLSVHRAVRQVREDLPAGFYRRLPRLVSPEVEEDGLPRTFCLAHALLATTHLQPSLAAAVQFIDAYQGDAPLSIGELWAFPTMLRLACLEILVAATDRIFPALPPPFRVSRWVSQFESLEPTERVARALGSLVTIDAIPWRDFFDRTSRVEAILRLDPHAAYANMDFDTRDRYRKAVEDLADGAQRTEWDVATTVLEQARAAHDPSDHDGARRQHVGYWLIDGGRAQLELLLGYRMPAGLATRRYLLRHPGACYATALAATTAAAVAIPLAYLWSLHASVVSLATGALLALLPATIVSVNLVHWLVMQFVPPRVLPKLDLADGLPDDCRTAVVIPVIVGNVAEVPGLLERLEMHWLTNADPRARFALLSDLVDAPAERVAGDAAIETALVDGIRELNRRYRGDAAGPFHLLHRARRYNACQNCWMCWERKRGKLEQFNRFLLGEADDFPLKQGDSKALRGIRYVVTVDADTMLPPGAMHRLVGTLAHPLNHADFDPSSGRVRAGYTVVQPRVEIAPESGPVSWFSRLYAGDTSIDIYSRAVSDVYQDLFGSAVYVGKGVYEVASFQHCLEGRVPDNALLSHDLFEGAHGRAALASDIALYDSFPSSYVEFAKRWHRWVRGDWQLAPWLLPKVRSQGGERIDNGIAVLDRWKMLDNLRRSVLPLSLVAFLLGGWFLLPDSPLVWTLLAIAAPGTYLLTDFITALKAPFNAVRAALRRSPDSIGHWALSVAFLAADAWISVDAIVRTLARLRTRRRLLEWTSAAHTAAGYAGASPRLAAWRMAWPASAFAAAAAMLLAAFEPEALAAAAPLLAVWLVSPEIAAWVSRPQARAGEVLEQRERAFLRRIARQTWLYFETFVGPEDNWLPPDNVQQDPYREIAHRTSPTNIGMLFASSLTAWDLGYLGAMDLALRVHNAFDAIDRLERYRGHVLNWYDTRTLAPLEPRYVSTVDNGNLAVCLVVLKEGCREIANAAPLRPQRWDGLLDTLAPLVGALRAHPANIWEQLTGPVGALVARIDWARDEPGEWHAALVEIADHTWPELEGAIAHAITAPDGPATPLLRDVHVWLERVTHHLNRMRWNFDTLQPWCALVHAAPAGLEAWAERIAEELEPATPLPQLIERCSAMREPLEQRIAHEHDPTAQRWLVDLSGALERGGRELGALRQRLLDTASRAEAEAFAMNFKLLYDADARLFRIGYNVSNERIDPHFYDLLATEARLASYFAIAKRDVPTEHWFYLRRPTTRANGELSLLSWNGSMFEYLMPALFLRSASDKLLGESERAAVSIQRRYSDGLGLPWGISESAFASRDAEHHYQYRAFGVPRLGLRRGLARDVVVAPYASALALAVAPLAAVRNLERLAELGAEGLYGFVEALDFTPERVAAGRSFTPIQAHMAHHQGMLLSAVGNVLTDDVMVRRFAADMRIRSASLLLQERIPWELPPAAISREEPAETPAQRRAATPAPVSWIPQGAPTVPNMHLLGNGRLASWVTENGGGGLWWYRQQLTRWSTDAISEPYGLWIYVHDRDSDVIWSIGRQPTGVASSDTRVVFHSHAAEFHRREHGIAIAMEIGVAPGDDLEIRRIRLVNESDRPRRLSITSYGEVVLGPPLDDERHPAFSKLFVASEHLPGLNALLFTRRPRGSSDQPPVLLHRLVVDDPHAAEVDFETDRAAFLGRGRGIHRPSGIANVSRTTGWTLDPIMSLQLSTELAPQQHQELAFVTFAAGSRESVLELAERYATLASLDWALNDAGREAARDVERLGLAAARLPQLQMLASLLLMPRAALSAAPAQVAANRLGQPALWALGISGDVPILLLHTSTAGVAELEHLIRGHQLWRRQGLPVDLVILRGGVSGYEEPVRERVLALMHEAGAGDSLGRRGGIHLVFADLVNTEQRGMLECLAAVILDADSDLDAQLHRVLEPRPMPPPFRVAEAVYGHVTTPIERPDELEFDSGFGGFAADGREYVMYLAAGQHTPAPWCNVLANESFGCLTTEAGGGFTWAVNSGENRLTPWSNDPVSDPPTEALYLRDEETAQVWTATPAPMGNGMPCQIRHGAGYTTWSTRSHGLEQEMTVFVPANDPVKVIRLKLTDLTGHVRRVTVTYYVEWLLGALKSLAHRHVVCEYEPRGGALLARNPWNPEFADRVAFLTSTRAAHSVTTDRIDFLGAEGGLARPAGLSRWDLGGYVGPSSDPCAAFQVHVDLAPGQSVEVAFVLGQGRDRAEALALIERWSDPTQIGPALDAVRSLWQQRLGAVQVETPNRAFDVMINHWLIYQTMASRVFARAGFYQAGGAIGFRDQLQDMLALLHVDARRVREHILHCAERQFEEGDVMHWWHPPAGRGVRTRCSDDLLWLPYVTSCYVAATGDHGILNEGVAFLRAPVLAPEEQDRYALFESTHERRPLFEHCIRALDHGTAWGPHRLPLIGSGDWNDGMNRLGQRGRGESVWLAWFSIATLEAFAPLARSYGRADLADAYATRVADLRDAVERSGWDGEWYLRALDDDGRPVGSHTSDECRIDSIAQSWAVLSSATPTDQARTALDAAAKQLIRDDERIVLLLWPPFHDTPRDIGYIKAYPPGIRENGGQYTHAAAWLGHALAKLRDSAGASHIFELLNPIHHAADHDAAMRYRAEPYVLAADVGSVAPHVGRAGWSWYTGAAGWTWRLGVEAILGLRRCDGGITLDPCLPPGWGGARIRVRGPSGHLSIEIEDPERVGSGVVAISLDGQPLRGGVCPLPTDGGDHVVNVRLGGAHSQASTGQ
jgi:cyclic beta-1,2-glucan glucanotransferase